MKRLLACLLLTGCVTVKPTPPNILVDERLREAVELFESTYEVKINFPVRVGKIITTAKMKNPPAGQCDPVKGVIIATEMLEIGFYDVVEEVVFHELGHCFFGREHKSVAVKEGSMKGCADSVMTSKQMLSYNRCWQVFKGHYVHELSQIGMCHTDYVYGGVCPTKWNTNPQFYHTQELGGGMQPSRFYRSPP